MELDDDNDNYFRQDIVFREENKCNVTAPIKDRFTKNPPNRRGKRQFERIYGLHSLLLLGLGNTIGSGFFTLIGVAAKMSGAAVFLSFLMSGMIALLTALAFAEFAALIPKAGSCYLYSYTVFGELAAWIIGWNQNLRYGGTAAT